MSEHQPPSAFFVPLTRSHWDALLRFATSLTGQKHSAEDILQASLLKAFRAFPRFLEARSQEWQGGDGVPDSPEFKSHLRNWLYRIVKNTWLDEQSQAKRLSFVDDEAVLDQMAGGIENPQHEAPFSGAQAVPPAELSQAEKAFYKEAADAPTHRRLEKLSPRQRSVLYLAAEGYTYREIATVLDIPMGTVMSTLSRAIARMKGGEA